MSHLVCWLFSHAWVACPFAEWTMEATTRCLGACVRCGKHKGVIACIVCERVAR
jgi:hypothetical protein